MAVDLAFSETGTGRPLVILHGLFGSRKNWASVARILGDRHRVLTVDLRNHGESPWDPLHDYPSMADDVAEFIRGRIDGRRLAVHRCRPDGNGHVTQNTGSINPS